MDYKKVLQESVEVKKLATQNIKEGIQQKLGGAISEMVKKKLSNLKEEDEMDELNEMDEMDELNETDEMDELNEMDEMDELNEAKNPKAIAKKSVSGGNSKGFPKPKKGKTPIKESDDMMNEKKDEMDSSNDLFSTDLFGNGGGSGKLGGGKPKAPKKDDMGGMDDMGDEDMDSEKPKASKPKPKATSGKDDKAEDKVEEAEEILNDEEMSAEDKIKELQKLVGKKEEKKELGSKEQSKKEDKPKKKEDKKILNDKEELDEEEELDECGMVDKELNECGDRESDATSSDFVTGQALGTIPYSDKDLNESVKVFQLNRKLSQLAKENNFLKQELKESVGAFNSLKNQMDEINLINGKLLYTNKLIKNSNLSEQDKIRIFESFDNAQSLREVKLVFESLSNTMVKNKRPQAMMREGVEKQPQRPQFKLNESVDPATEKMLIIAGIMKKRDY